MKILSLPVAILAIALASTAPAAASGPLPGSAQLLAAPASDIVGAWEFQVHVVNCATGQTFGQFRAASLFNAGGTMLDTNTAPPTSRGPGFGVWTFDRSTGRYVVDMRLYRYNADGSFAGTTQLRRVLALSADGASASGTFTGQILGPAEQLIASTCGEETGVRAL